MACGHGPNASSRDDNFNRLTAGVTGKPYKPGGPPHCKTVAPELQDRFWLESRSWNPATESRRCFFGIAAFGVQSGAIKLSKTEQQ